MSALEAQPCITVITTGARRGDTLALAADQMLLRCGVQGLALGKTHPERNGCRTAIDRSELNPFGAPLIVNKMVLDDRSHDSPQKDGQISIFALDAKYLA
jgi:hypothetical protein